MKNFYLKTICAVAAILIIIVVNKQVSSSGSGAPAGYAGDPSNGTKTCATSCHTGAQVINMPGLITSNIPAQGYTPGNTYTVTGIIAMPGHAEFGFQVSPQDATGNLMGSLTLTNSTETKLVGSGKYITHTTAGATGTDMKTWSFDWTAPASGDVTFYGTFMASNNDASKNGDTTYLSSLSFSPVGIADANNQQNYLSVFPNPVSEKINVRYAIDNPGLVEILLVDITGRTVKELKSENQNSGEYTEVYELNSFERGMYFITIRQGNSEQMEKLIVN